MKTIKILKSDRNMVAEIWTSPETVTLINRLLKNPAVQQIDGSHKLIEA